MAIYFQPIDATSADELLFPTEQIPVRLDIQTIDNGEIGEIFGDLSQPFEIAADETTNKYFKHAMDNSGQEIPGVYQTIEGSLLSDTETLVRNAALIIESWDSTTNKYTCKLEASIVPLNDVLDGLLLSGEDQTFDADSFLSDNPWDTYDHDYNMSTWKEKNNEFSYSEYFYPFIDFGFDEDGRPRIPDGKTVLKSSLQSVPDTSNQSANNYNQGQDYDYWAELYGETDGYYDYVPTVAFNQPQPIILEPSLYFGEVSRDSDNWVTQGFISNPSTPLRIDQLKPAIKLKTVVDTIFDLASNKAGRQITVDTSTWTDELNNCYILPNEEGGLGLPGSYTSAYGASVDSQVSSTDTTRTVVLGDILANNQSEERDNIFKHGAIIGEHGYLRHTNTEDNDATYFVDATNFGGDGEEFLVPYTGTYTFKFTGTLIITGKTKITKDRHRANFVAAITKDGKKLASGPDIRVRRDTSNNSEYPFDITHTGTFYEGERVSAGIFTVYTKATADGKKVNASWKDVSFYTEAAPLDWSSQTAKLGDQFGELECTEMLKAIFEKFNMVIVPDKNKKDHYKIIQYYDWILDGVRRDWSDRVSDIRFENIFANQEDKIDFIPAEDDDKFSQVVLENDRVYGQHTFESDSDVSDGEREIGGFFGTLINAEQTEAYGGFNGVQIQNQSHETPIGVDGIPHLYELDEGDKKAIATKPRIGFRRPVTVDPFYYADGNDPVSYWAGKVHTLCSSGYDGQGDTNWSNEYPITQDGAYDKYWKDYIEHLYHKGARKMKAKVRFLPGEINEFGINDTIHIQGSDYLISKISGFNLSHPDEVEVEFITYRNNFDTVFTDWTPRYVEDTSDIRNYTLGVKFQAKDDEDANLYNVATQSTHLISVRGQKGTDQSVTVDSKATPSGADMTITDSDGFSFLAVGDYVDFAGYGGTVKATTSTTATITFYSAADATSANAVTSADGGLDLDYLDNDREEFVERVTFIPKDGYDLSASNFAVDGTAPTGVTVGDFTDDGKEVYVDLTIEIQDDDKSETITIESEVDPIATDVYSTEITFSLDSALVDAELPNATKEVKGNDGDQIPVTVFISAVDGKQLHADQFTFTDSTYVELIGFYQVGYDVIGEFNAIIGSSDQTPSVEIDATVADYSSTRPSTASCALTLDFNESITNVSVAPSASFTIDGAQGTSFLLPVTGYAADGYTLAADNFSVEETSDSNGAYTYIDTEGGGPSVTVLGKITFPNVSTASATLNVTGSAQAEDAQQQTITVTFDTVDDDDNSTLTNCSISDTSATEDFVGDYDTDLFYTVYIYPDSEYEITTKPTVTSSDTSIMSVQHVVPTADGHWAATLKISFGDSATDSATLSLSASATAVTPISKGDDGISYATLVAYRKAATAPSAPSDTTVTFNADGTVSWTAPTNWSQSIPSGTDQLYITTDSVSRQGAGTATASWSTPATFAEDGSDGADGLSYAEILIYQRATSAPDTPSSTTVTFAAAAISYTAPTGWSKTIAGTSGTNQIYVSQGVASRQGLGTDSVSWSAPKLLAEFGADGEDAVSISEVFLYRRKSGDAPSAPSDTTFTFAASGISWTAPTGWSKTIQGTSGTDTLYITQAFPSRAGLGTDTASWSTPVAFAANNGADGVDGANGTDGKSTAQVTIWNRAAATPTQPGSGSYNFDTDTLTAPTGWATYPGGASGTDPTLYSSSAIVTSNVGGGGTITIASTDWSSPSETLADGADGADGTDGVDGTDGTDGVDGTDGTDGTDGVDGKSTYHAYIYRRSSTAPSTPTGGKYNFGTNTLTPPTGWVATIGDTSGTDTLYISEETFSTTGNTGEVNAGTWSTPEKFAANDGADGADGADGDDGKSTYLYQIWRRAATQPDTPTGGSFNFGTNVGTAPTGWSNSAPAADGNDLWLSTALASITGDSGTDSSLTWGTPVKSGLDWKYTFRINLNSTDAYNAKINKTHIDIPFNDDDITSPASTDDTGWTFTMTAADGDTEYTSGDDLSISSSNTTLLDDDDTGDDANLTYSVTSGVITVSIGSITFPTSAPESGLTEVDLTVGGAAPMKPHCVLESEATQEYGPSYVTGDSGTGHTFFYRYYRVRFDPKPTSSNAPNTNGKDLYTSPSGNPVLTKSGITLSRDSVASTNNTHYTTSDITSTNTNKWSRQDSYNSTSGKVLISLRYVAYGEGDVSGTSGPHSITVHHPDAGSDTSGNITIDVPPIPAKSAREYLVDNGDLPPDRTPAATYRPGAVYFEKES